MGEAVRTPGGGGKLQRKVVVFYQSGNFSVNAVTNFSIADNIAKKLTSDNFVAYVEGVNTTAYSNSIRFLYSISYNPDTFIVTMTLSKNFAQLVPYLVKVVAFWVE